MLQDSRIITRLSLGFALVLLGTLLLGAIGARSVILLGNLTADIFQHPFAVTANIRDMRSEFLVAQKILGSIARTATPTEADNLYHQLIELGRTGDAHLAVVRERYLGKPEDVEKIRESLAAWRNTRDEVVALVRQDRRAAAISWREERANPQGDAVLDHIKVVADFAANKAAAFEAEATRTRHETLQNVVGVLVVCLFAGTALALLITRGITRPLNELRARMARLAAGELDVEVPYQGLRNELGAMADSVQILKDAAVRLEDQRWIKANTTDLATALQAAANPHDFAQVVVGKLVPLLQGGAGAFYYRHPDRDSFERLGTWGLPPQPHMPQGYKAGESLVGQCVMERHPIVLNDVPDDYLRIASGIGEAPARTVLVAPVMSQTNVMAVLEIASFHAFTANQQALIDEAMPIIALTLEIQQRSENTRVLLEQTQQQAEELRATEEELRAQAEEIQAANEELRSSEEELKVQHEELQSANAELAEKTRLAEEARREASARAAELDTASRYKSEFLANMSHELRTPLNSLLILAHGLAENAEGNLAPSQVESAAVIAESGTHLLHLINDILDLSKVEAGKMDIHADAISLTELGDSLLRRFQPLARVKGLDFSLAASADLPATIMADRGKIDQILNNLVGNAIKFTEHGSVTVRIDRRESQLAIEIVDTGIGVPAEKLDPIFRAFEQADGSDSRRFGGTGLGLTISRKLARLMGGEVTASSSVGQGSRFLFMLPIVAPDGDVPATATTYRAPPAAPVSPLPTAAATTAVADDRDNLAPNDEVILIIEDDVSFARIVRDLAHKNGFKCLVAGNGKAGIDLARRYRPTGIVLDIGLPGMDGWTVMDQLKTTPDTRDIPVQFMSATEAGQRGLAMGAAGFLTKPVSRQQIVDVFERLHNRSVAGMRRLLLVEDDKGTRKAVATLLAPRQVEIVAATRAEEAMARLRDDKPFDCMVLDLGLPDLDGHALLERCRKANIALPPVVIYSARELSEPETLALREYTDSIIVKGAHSHDRLLDDVTLFLHSVQTRLPEAQQRMLRGRQTPNNVPQGPLALVVDDDMRNTFALSKLLRSKGLRVVMAQDGRTALDQLETVAGIDVVLMDIMMPGMDGYTAIREIRRQDRFRSLPVIALTAKAMPGDRDKCLGAGADDYITKPVDIAALLSLIDRHVQRTAA